MTTFQTKKNVMKNQGQANNINNLNDPTVAIDQQAHVEFDDLSMSGEQEERVKGGASSVLFQYQLDLCAEGKQRPALDPQFSGGVRVGS